jgi:hypothetical protein
MDMFSVEYKQKLVNEHKLVVASINQLNERRHMYVQNHTIGFYDAAVAELKKDKIILEAKIDVLSDFLDA